MLRKLSVLKGYQVNGKDNDFGKVKDLYFDQKEWILRYIVVDTGNWLIDEKTLISTDSFANIDHVHEKIEVELTTEELERGPSLKKNKPVSKVMEERLTKHFNWPLYWTGYGTNQVVAPAAMQPGYVIRKNPLDFDYQPTEQNTNEEIIKTNLRSFNEVTGYHIQANDGEIGHLENLFAEEESWIIRYLLIDTRNWLPGKDVVIAPEWIKNISWNKEKIIINKDQATIKNAPEYNPDIPIDRKYENEIYEHYNELKYWNL